MIQHAHDSGCLDSEIEGTHGRSDDLPPVKGWRCIVRCEGLRDDKKAKHLFESVESVGQQRSDAATYFGNRLALYLCLRKLEYARCAGLFETLTFEGMPAATRLVH